MQNARDHLVHFHRGVHELAPAVARFIVAGLRAGEAGLLVARAESSAGIRSELLKLGVNVPSLEKSGRLTFLDAATVLEAITKDGKVDALRVRASIGRAVERLVDRHGRVSAYGEVVDLLEQRNEHAEAMHLERAWDEILAKQPLSLLCGYDLVRFAEPSHERAFNDVCAAHFASNTPARETVAELPGAKRRYERLLQEAAGTLTVGRVASYALHDLGNLIVGLSGAAGELSRSLPADSPLRALVEELEESSLHCTHLVRDVLSVSRPESQLERDDFADASRTTRELAAILRRLTGTSNRLDIHCESDLGLVPCSKTELTRLLTNLTVNARQASEHEGRVRIDVLRDRRARPGFAYRDWILFRVTDEGQGMDATTLGRILQPHFTTKRGGGGSGLGLSIVQDIVHKAGGFLEVESAPGRGASFRVYLPRVDNAHLH